jgi:hypothetical protein
MVSRDSVADETNDDDGSHDLVYISMLMLTGEWYVFVLKTITYNTSLARRECSYYVSCRRYLPPRVNMMRIEYSRKK